MQVLSPDDELEIACLIGTGSGCRALELMPLAMQALRDEREKVKSLKVWIKALDRQLERYKS